MTCCSWAEYALLVITLCSLYGIELLCWIIVYLCYMAARVQRAAEVLSKNAMWLWPTLSVVPENGCSAEHRVGPGFCATANFGAKQALQYGHAVGM